MAAYALVPFLSYVLFLQPAASIALPASSTATTEPSPATSSPASSPSPSGLHISPTLIGICVTSGVVLVATIFTVWWILRQRSRAKKEVSYPDSKHLSCITSTSISSSMQSASPVYEKLPSTLALSANASSISTPYKAPSGHQAPEVPQSNKSKNERSRSRGKSLGGIYELPASPRRLMIPTWCPNGGRYSPVSPITPVDRRNKMLPEIPGEKRIWI